jgi:hypothetical protein
VVAGVLKSGDAVVAGHWAYLAWLIVAALAGGALVWRGVKGRAPRPGAARAVLRWVAAAAGLAFAAATFWLAPYRVQVADTASLDAPAGVVVSSNATSIRLDPDGEHQATGLAFIPGALVDPRAYIPILTPLAQAGHPVYIAKPPLGIAFLTPGVAARASSAFPEATGWVMAGHSLGGVVASGQADAGGEAGLILLASYPLGDLSGSDLPVLSISGSADGLTTPDDVEASRAILPGDTEFVVVDGGVHAFFGDYGPQAGDGTPDITRDEAQAEIVDSMLTFLDQIPR